MRLKSGSGKREAGSVWMVLVFTAYYLLLTTPCLSAEVVKKNTTNKAKTGYELKKSTLTSPSAATKPVEPVETEESKIDTQKNIEKLKDKNWILRRNAAISLGAKKSKRAVLPLIGLLKDANTEVRRCAAVALGEIGDKQAVQDLIITLNDSEGGMVIDSANSLGELSDPSAVDGLLKLLSDGRPLIRISALKSLFSFKNDVRVSSAIINCINDEAEGVRLVAVQQASSLKLRFAVPNLIKNLSDVNLKVRIEAVKALGEIGDTRAIVALKKITKNENPELDAAVKEAVSKLEGRNK